MNHQHLAILATIPIWWNILHSKTSRLILLSAKDSSVKTVCYWSIAQMLVLELRQSSQDTLLFNKFVSL